MALFGGSRDINLFKHFNKELTEKIIEQYVGYYKLTLNETDSNIYGESLNKKFNDPILIPCLLKHDTQENKNESTVLNINRNIIVSFLKDKLREIEVYPEIGDVVFWNNDYFEVETRGENQFIFGKDNDYNYSDDYLDNFGESFSIQLRCRYISSDKLNLENSRL